MNAIILGQSTKMAEILSFFCDKVYICLDNSFKCNRHFKELDNYTILQSKNNIKTIKGVIPKTKEIRKLIKEYNISVIFSQTKYDMIAAKLASMLTRKKIILLGTSHNSYAWLNDRSVRNMSWLIRSTTDCYVALASFVYNKLKKLGVKEKNIVLLPNTIEYNMWKVKTNYSTKDTFKMVYVAYVYPGKCQHILVDILEKIKEYDIVIDCYGDTNNAKYIERILQSIDKAGLKGKINLKGRIENSDLRDILCNYDAYICPSFMEMSPVNILEAQAAGLPVLASNIGGIPDMVKHNETGVLFERDNITDAAEKIKMIINDERIREKLGKAGRKFVSAVYTSKEANIKLYNKILNLKKWKYFKQ